MNQIGLHIGYWWGSSIQEDIEEILYQCYKANMDILEINPTWLLKLDDKACDKLLSQAKAYSMSFTLNGGLDATTDISSDNPLVRQRGIEHCVQVLKRMPALEMKVWSGVNYSAWLRMPQTDEDFTKERKRAKEFSRQSLQQILPVAEELGINYCFEVCNRFEQFVFNTGKEALDFAVETCSDRAMVHLDSFHMLIEENNIFDTIAGVANAGRLGHLHLGESNRRIPGIGPSNIDWHRFITTLKKVKYSGPLVLEPFVLPEAFNAHRTRTWRSLNRSSEIYDMTQDAAQGAAFLRKLM